MKNLLFLLLAFFAIQITSAQEKTLDQDKSLENNSIYSLAGTEVRPEYPGGIDAFYKFIAKKYRVPNDKAFKGGKVIVTFVIEKDGSLTDIKVIRDPGFGTGDEAIRVLEKCKKWSPAQQAGRLVRVQYSLPIAIPSN